MLVVGHEFHSIEDLFHVGQGVGAEIVKFLPLDEILIESQGRHLAGGRCRDDLDVFHPANRLQIG